jgi:tRNA dimethylallyltransferase
MKYELLGIIGPTAVGKTKLAVAWAAEVEGEIISVDSRQVYREMDLGSGKDLEEYTYKGEKIPYHLIDIIDAGEAYDLFRFQEDFFEAFRSIQKRDKQAVLCGGTGMYIQAALNKEQLLQVPINEVLRLKLADYSQAQLNDYLIEVKPNVHNRSDLEDRERTIRAIEIAQYEKEHPEEVKASPVNSYLLFGIQMPREKLRKRIEVRLQDRLESGMIKEVEQLLEQGVSHEQLQYYGLEYKFVSLYLQEKLSYDELFSQLLQAIRRFAKKQMTWYRRMERQGYQIHWMDAESSLEEKLKFIRSIALKN